MHLVRLVSGRHRYQHAPWVLDYVVNTAGRVRVASRDRPWRARLPGTLHLYPPGTIYWEDYPGDSMALTDFAFVFFWGGEAAGLDQLINLRVGYARFLDPEGLAWSLLEAIVRIGQQSGEAGFWQAQAALCQLIDLLRKSEPEDGETRRIGHPAPVAPPCDLIRKTDAYLCAHLARRVTLEDLARHLHVSVSALSHRYHAEIGATPMTRLTQMRIERAKTLLLGGQKLDAIVEATGFSDKSHLSRTFRRFEGVSPQAYRQRLGVRRQR
jgi:AraC-like DNA-binding protein